MLGVEVVYRPMKRLDIDRDNVVERYRSGETISHICEVFAADYKTIRTILARAGVEVRSKSEETRLRMSKLTGPEIATLMAPARLAKESTKGMPNLKRRIAVDDRAIVSRYASGESEKAIAESLGVSRSVVRRRLLDAGVNPRGGSESMRIRMANMTSDERKLITTHARSACTQSRQETLSVVGWGENTLRDWLVDRGCETIPQLAMGPYNIDLAVHPVAVEVWNSATNPLRLRRAHEKAKYLRERGWSLVWVWIRKDHVFDERVADEIVAIIERTRLNPSTGCEHWVIRGSGEFAPVRKYDTNDIAIVEPH